MSQDPSPETNQPERVSVRGRGKQHLTQFDTWVLVQDTRIRLDDKIDRLGERLEGKIDKLDHKIERLEDRVDALGEEIVVVRKEVIGLDAKIIGLDAKIDRTSSEFRNEIVMLGSELRNDIVGLDAKIDRTSSELRNDIVGLGSELRKEFNATLDRKLDRQTNFISVMFVVLGLVITVAIGVVGWVIPAMR